MLNSHWICCPAPVEGMHIHTKYTDGQPCKTDITFREYGVGAEIRTPNTQLVDKPLICFFRLWWLTGLATIPVLLLGSTSVRILCESSNYRFTTCDVSGLGDHIVSVALDQQLSSTICVLDSNYGLNSTLKAIWVSSGCRGYFTVQVLSTGNENNNKLSPSGGHGETYPWPTPDRPDDWVTNNPPSVTFIRQLLKYSSDKILHVCVRNILQQSMKQNEEPDVWQNYSRRWSKLTNRKRCQMKAMKII